MRPLDHFVIGTPDLEALAGRFAALGFTVGARNRHPWGTENKIIQFADQTFFELITVGDATLIPSHAPRAFSFGAFVRDAISRAPGLSMLVLKSRDARKDVADFVRSGIGDFEPFDFARKGKRADGSEVEVAFSLAFAANRLSPEMAFFTCQQHFPQNFWAPAAQAHANGASGISAVTLMAENPSDHAEFLGHFTGQREMRVSSSGVVLPLGTGAIEVLDPAAFAFRNGTAISTDLPRFGAISIRVPDPAALASRARASGLPLLERVDAVILPPTPDFSTVLRFERGEGV